MDWFMYIIGTLGMILYFAGLVFIVYAIVRAFRRGYGGWAWGIIGWFCALPIGIIIFEDTISESVILIIFIVAISLGIPVYIFLISKLPKVSPIKCEACEGEAIAIREVTVNLADEIVPSRISSLILSILGGAVSILGIWLFIFAAANGMSIFGPGLVVVAGISLLGKSLNNLFNRQKNLSQGYMYKCKECKKKFTQKVEDV